MSQLPSANRPDPLPFLSFYSNPLPPSTLEAVWVNPGAKLGAESWARLFTWAQVSGPEFWEAAYQITTMGHDYANEHIFGANTLPRVLILWPKSWPRKCAHLYNHGQMS